MVRRRTWLWCFLSLASVLAISGCLEQESLKILRYDPQSDSFHLLALYQHFRSSGDPRSLQAQSADTFKKDLASLRELWEVRGRMIPGPYDLGGPAYLDTADAKREPGDPEIAWDKVRIKPGDFFKDADGTLGFWQEAEFPGAVVDQLMALARSRLSRNADFLAAIDAEIQRRDNGKLKPADWDAFGKLLAQALGKLIKPGEPADAAAKDDANQLDVQIGEQFLACLDLESLKAFRAAVVGQAIGPTRSAARVKFHLPLTARDSKALLALRQQIDPRAASLPDRQRFMSKGNLGLLILLSEPLKQTMTAQAAADGLDITIDAPPLLNRLSAETYEWASKSYNQSPENQARAKALADEAAAQWNDIHPKTDIDPAKLINEFSSNRLAR